jgi:membrane-bound lytic murein transglycosylase F
MWALRLLVGLAVLATGCDRGSGPVAPYAQSGELVVLTVNGPATYFEDAEGHPSGFEHDLAELFAQSLGVKARFVLVSDASKIAPAIARNRAHLAAAALARRAEPEGGPAWGPTYFTAQRQIVVRSGEAKPRGPADLAGLRVGAVDEPWGEEPPAAAQAIPATVERLPPGTTSAELLQRVLDNRLDAALVESTRFTLLRKHFPPLEVAFAVGKPVDYAWLVAPLDQERLLAAMPSFFERIRKDGTLRRLVDRHYGHAQSLSAIDSGTLLERVGTMLPPLKPHFQEAEQVSGIDWRLIAAIGYQESHWNPLATSPTGVRGLMMLTEDTAVRLKVKDRLDARESILGGARYLSLLRAEGIPARIREPDRTYLAIAAYNLGTGHVEDARILAQRSGLNPDLWQDVRQVIGRLADPVVYPTLPHGFARGYEAQRFVDNVRNFHDMLDHLAPREAPLVPRTAATQGSTNAGTSPR